MAEKVQVGKKVRIAYTVRVDNQVVETTKGKPPLFYEQGKPQVLPAIQNHLEGRQEGECVKFDLSPSEAYGDYDENKIENVSMSEMPEKEKLKVGMILQDKDKEGKLKIARVKEIRDDFVVLDFNHPMAGKILSYEVDIVTVMNASPFDGVFPRVKFEDERPPQKGEA